MRCSTRRRPMNKPILIENARIIDPATNAGFKGALLIEGGRIADMAEGEAPGTPEKSQRIDAGGMILTPGLIDMRVFTGEPGHEHRETLKSAGRAAAAGGVTSIVVMPDTQPVIDDGALVEFIARHAQAVSGV